MLDSKKRKAYSSSEIVTVVGPGTVVSGEIRSKGAIRIEGQVHGVVQSDDTIEVLETGKVKAHLIAGQVIVGGEVEGNILAQERLEVVSRAKIIGDITAPRISIAEGVLFEGHCVMDSPEKVALPPLGAAPAPESDSAPANDAAPEA